MSGGIGPDADDDPTAHYTRQGHHLTETHARRSMTASPPSLPLTSQLEPIGRRQRGSWESERPSWGGSYGDRPCLSGRPHNYMGVVRPESGVMPM